jgi:hypothetical protein
MTIKMRLALGATLVTAFACVNAFANTATLVFSSVDHPGTSTMTVDGNTCGSSGNAGNNACYISPYTGTLGGLAVSLYCDDFNNDIGIGSTSTVAVTNLVGGDTSNSSSTTRFATVNDAANITVADHGNVTLAMPTGTVLYEELAWLFTQLGAQAQSASPNSAIEDSLAEAAWDMTTPASKNHVPTNYSNDAKDWIWLASQDYNNTGNYSVTVGTGGSSFSLGIVNPNYSAWFILDDSSSALNAAETTGQQEQLAYYGNHVPSVPEPSAFGLAGIGGVLLLGAVLTRSRRKQ